MIQPIKMNSNIAFRANEATAEEKKPALKERFFGVVKDVNTISNVTSGAIRGVVDGAAGAVAVGVIGKSIKESKGQIGDSIARILEYSWQGIKGVLSFIPSVITKSPLENAGTIIKLPSKFYNNMLKDNKAVAAIATASAVAILALRTLQGKINANKQNAEIDHKANIK